MAITGEVRHYVGVALSVTLSILVGFGLSSIFILAIGSNPLTAYYTLLQGAFGSTQSISETLIKSIPLIFTGLAAAVAFKSNVNNIGEEGQLYMGAIATAIVALSVPVLPSFAFMPLLLCVSFLAGAFWAGIPAFLKIRFGADEMLTTLLMNWIPFYIVSYIVSGPFQEKDKIRPQTDFIPDVARLPAFVAGYRVHWGLVLAIVACVLVYVFLWKTSLGFEFRATGANLPAARSVGIKVNRRMIQAMILSGGIAAFAGFCEVAGTVGTLKLGSSNILGYGYAGILVALVTNLHPLGVILSGLFFGILIVGSESMQRGADVPIAMVYIIEAIMVMTIITSQILMRKLGFKWLTGENSQSS
jgi:simple sugar transport system permease protein